MSAQKQGSTRIDALLVEQRLAEDLRAARALVLRGVVLVDEQRVDKAGTRVARGAQIRLKITPKPYVSRGGLKLEHALDAFDVEVAGAVCWDLGASTGGFTDCLLQRGARHVYAIDVGRGQLDWKLQGDRRVTQIEGVNVRHLEWDRVPERPDIVTVDLAFISLRLVLPRLRDLAPLQVVALVKPQFEAYREELESGGVVRDRQLRERILERLHTDLTASGVGVLARADSPIRGQKGNQESFFLCRFDDQAVKPGESRS